MAIAIKAEHVSKEYRLGIINHGVLFRDIQSWWARKTGKPDPHSKIGAEHFADQEDRFWALKDVSFEIEQGDRVGIIGRNGAGKSTLLKILSRITEPTEGRVAIKGRVASLLEVGTGFHPELTGRDNIYLNGAILGMKRREVAKKLDEIVAFSEVEQFIDTPVKRYSSGMYVRLAFAVAAHLDNEILLADEVLAVGDAEFQKKSLLKMEKISKEEGKTIFFVSHQLTMLSGLCEKGLLLEKGRMAFSGTIKDVISYYTRSQTSKENNLMWEKTEELPYENILQLKRFYLCKSDGQIASSFSEIDRPLINIEVKVLIADPRIGFSLAFYDNNSSLLFSTELYDHLPPEKVKDLIGEVIIKIPLPVEFFTTKKYYVELMCYLNWTGYILPPVNDSRLSFNITRQKLKNIYGGDNRLGSLILDIPWNVSHV